MTTANDYFNERFPHSHTLPKQSIIELMEGYFQHRKDLYNKARDSFNAEQFIANLNFDEIRKRLKNDPKNK